MSFCWWDRGAVSGREYALVWVSSNGVAGRESRFAGLGRKVPVCRSRTCWEEAMGPPRVSEGGGMDCTLSRRSFPLAST